MSFRAFTFASRHNGAVVALAGIIAIGSLFTSTLRAADAMRIDPELERKTFRVAEGWEVNLFAAEPLIEKPVQMNWDTAGRLWCATSATYPQVKPGTPSDDKIIVLEDTAGSGHADKSTIFADHLLIPMSVAPGDGGAYVTNSTEVIHLRDTKGNGKADERTVVLDGFGTEDTHHIIHTLRWGPDGRLYFNQSIYIHGHVSTPHGLKTLLASGVWRFHPRTMELDVYTRGLVNPWGDVWDRWGNFFQTDGAGGGGINFSFPGAAFESAAGFERTLPGLNPGSPKYCGEEILSGRHIPDAYQGNILTNDFRANRIVRFKLSEAGSGFSSKQMPDFITSTDSAFRPVDIKMGPDGAVYIADWYNPIINHGEVDFRDARRDHTHGRIWRVTAKGSALVERPKIAGAPVADLLNLLGAPEDYTRQQVKLELRERSPEQVAAALATWVKAMKGKDPDREHRLLEGLWTYQTIDVVEPQLLGRLLTADDAHARAAAVRIASRWAGQLGNINELLGDAVADEDPRVRLEAVRALALIPSPQSITIATRVLDKPMDPFLDFALWLTANELKEVWLPAFQSGRLTAWAKPAHLTYALQAVKSPAAITSLISQLKTNQIPPESRGDVIDLIAGIDPAGQVGTLFDLAHHGEIKDGPTRARLLVVLEHIAREGHVPPPGNASQIRTLIDDADPQVRAAALRLAGAWRVQQLRPELTQLAESDATAEPVRSAAFDGLSSLGGPESVALFQKLSEPPAHPQSRSLAIAALTALNLEDAATRAANLLTADIGAANAFDPAPLLGAFLRREGGGEALAKALAGKKLPADTAKLSLRYLQSLASTDSPLSDVVRKSIGLSSGPTRLTPGQMKQMIAEVMEKGDAARGEQVFRSKQTGCYQCHAIGGAGGWLAPDLRAIGASSPVDYLIDSVLDPNKAVKDGYAGYTIVTREGEVYSGIKVRQDAKLLVLRDNAHAEINIPVASIKQQKQVGSLMLSGLADTLTHGEFLDLIRFLSDLGKPGPYGASTTQLVRRWSVLQAIPQSSTDPNAPPAIAAADSPAWGAEYAMVSGVLPVAALSPQSGARVAFVQCQLDVATPGKIRLVLNSVKGLQAWIDGKPVPVASTMSPGLERGVHTLAFRIDLRERGVEGLSVEVADEPGSTAHAQPLGGK